MYVCMYVCILINYMFGLAWWFSSENGLLDHINDQDIWGACWIFFYRSPCLRTELQAAAAEPNGQQLQCSVDF